MQGENSMRAIKVAKVTVNMGVGPDADAMKVGRKIIEKITGSKAVQTKCKVRQPKWGIRPGLPIGLKVTLRNGSAEDFLKRALAAKSNQLGSKCVDSQGNFGFGIKEYIDLPGVKYDPTLGVRGFDVLVTLERPGYRVKRRKVQNCKVGKKHVISRQDAVGFIKEKFGVEFE
jgi:large subunit ribosomal protein L5